MERVNLLSDLEMINKADKEDLLKLIKVTEDQLKITITEENGGVLITHVAAMFTRNKTGENIGALDEVIIKELRSHERFEETSKLVDKVVDEIDNHVSELERYYLLLHFCTLINTI